MPYERVFQYTFTTYPGLLELTARASIPCSLSPVTNCNVVQFAPGYVCVSECECECNSVKMTRSNSTRSGNDRSGRAMGEEESKTAKSEFRLGMKCILYRGFIYR